MRSTRSRRRAWYAFVVAVLVVGGAITFFILTRGSHDAADEIEAATQVFESLRPGEPTGFDPTAWELVANKAAIVPAGGRIEVVPSSWDVRATFASVDVNIILPGRPVQRQWVFLRKLRGEWLIYGSLPLDG